MSGDAGLRVMVACCGLGRVRRGFETFAEECFEALTDQPDVHPWLVQGAGAVDGLRLRAWSLDRRGRIAQSLAPLCRTVPKRTNLRPYCVEEVSFALGLIPLVWRHRPDVVLFSDPHLGLALSKARRLLPPGSSLLFSNGGPVWPPYAGYDWIHHTTRDTFDLVDGAGTGTGQTWLPYGFAFDDRPLVTDESSRVDLRRRLGLPEHERLLICVGALSPKFKRMSYVIDEVARLPEPRPHLVILGDQQRGESVVARANARLGPDGVTIRTVPSHEVIDYYDAADAFVLGSLSEGFGRVYVEALARGLPCVAHDTRHTRDVLGDHAVFADLREPGAGAGAMAEALGRTGGAGAAERARYARQTFSWDTLAPAYVAMLRECAARSRARGRRPRTPR